jgi:hypothetical protein
MNEVLAYGSTAMRALMRRASYAKVYLTVWPYDGSTSGVSISENVDENFVENRFGTRKGAIPSLDASAVHDYGRRLGGV